MRVFVYGIGAVAAALLLNAAPAAGQQPAAATPYEAPRIVRPAGSETIFDNAGTVPVEVALQPALRADAGHRLRVLLDGKPLPGAWSTTSFALPEIDRGTHTLQVIVTDGEGQQLAASAAVEFNMWRASRLFPSRKKAP